MTRKAVKKGKKTQPIIQPDIDAATVTSFQELPLPALPAVLRYVNEGGDPAVGSIVSPSIEDVWCIKSRGVTMTLRFDAFPAFLRPLLKVVSADSLSNLMAASVAANYGCLKRAGAKRIVEVLLSTPSQVAAKWADIESWPRESAQ